MYYKIDADVVTWHHIDVNSCESIIPKQIIHVQPDKSLLSYTLSSLWASQYLLVLVCAKSRRIIYLFHNMWFDLDQPIRPLHHQSTGTRKYNPKTNHTCPTLQLDMYFALTANLRYYRINVNELSPYERTLLLSGHCCTTTDLTLKSLQTNISFNIILVFLLCVRVSCLAYLRHSKHLVDLLHYLNYENHTHWFNVLI
jgi:hypothetical protein